MSCADVLFSLVSPWKNSIDVINGMEIFDKISSSIYSSSIHVTKKLELLSTVNASIESYIVRAL